MKALAFLLLLRCLTATLQWGRADTPADTAQILEGLRNKYKLPALAVVVLKDGQVCDRAAVGVRKHGAPALVTTNDWFHIGSCTKSMTATLAAMLIEHGKLRWDTTLGEVFTELKGKMDRQYETVTLEQLLQHRGGAPGEPPALVWLQALTDEGPPAEQRYRFIAAVLRKPPEAAPGTKHIYSNQGYAIAGAMLEKLTGTPWETLMTNYVFKPLHMDTAAFGPPGALGKVEQPWGHTRFLSQTRPSQEDNPPAIGPAGRVHCSLDDLARYAAFHLRGKPDGVLKPDTLRRLHTPPAGEDYAYGWVCVTNPKLGPVLWHNGSNSMWYVLMWLAPRENFAVIVGSNIGGNKVAEAVTETARAMVRKWTAK